MTKLAQRGQMIPKMKTNLLLTLIPALALSFLCGCASTSKRDMSALQGTWVGHEVDGPPGDCRMTIAGTSLKFQGAQQEEWYAARLILNPSAISQQADVLIEDCPAPQYIRKTAKTIYKIEGKTLTVAGHEPGDETVPAGFERDGRTRVFVFTRP